MTLIRDYGGFRYKGSALFNNNQVIIKNPAKKTIKTMES